MHKPKPLKIEEPFILEQPFSISVDKERTKKDVGSEIGRLKKANKHGTIPLLYSCSGCSNVAQLANDIAVKMDFEGIAEMSCIAGVGGKVESLVKKARSNRAIIVIDGCPLQCARECLWDIGLKPNVHIILTDYNLKKRHIRNLDLKKEMEIFEQIVEIVGKI